MSHENPQQTTLPKIRVGGEATSWAGSSRGMGVGRGAVSMEASWRRGLSVSSAVLRDARARPAI